MGYDRSRREWTIESGFGGPPAALQQPIGLRLDVDAERQRRHPEHKLYPALLDQRRAHCGKLGSRHDQSIRFERQLQHLDVSDCSATVLPDSVAVTDGKGRL